MGVQKNPFALRGRGRSWIKGDSKAKWTDAKRKRENKMENSHSVLLLYNICPSCQYFFSLFLSSFRRRLGGRRRRTIENESYNHVRRLEWLQVFFLSSLSPFPSLFFLCTEVEEASPTLSSSSPILNVHKTSKEELVRKRGGGEGRRTRTRRLSEDQSYLAVCSCC